VLDLDRYIARESPLHAADARLKFLLTIAFIVAIGLLPTGSFAAIGIAWAVLVALSATAGLGPFRLTRGAFLALPFMLAAVPLIFTRPEDPIGSFALGPLTITVSGYGLLLFLTTATKTGDNWPALAVWAGDRKLLVGKDPKQVELFRFPTDRFEKSDLSREQTADVARLRALLAAWTATLPVQPDPACFSASRAK
jgi:energy-coupling factor transporter transmembrane protein EcfT